MWILFTGKNLRSLRFKSSEVFLKCPPDPILGDDLVLQSYDITIFMRPSLVQVMAWYQTGNKPLSEPMMTQDFTVPELWEYKQQDLVYNDFHTFSPATCQISTILRAMGRRNSGRKSLDLELQYERRKRKCLIKCVLFNFWLELNYLFVFCVEIRAIAWFSHNEAGWHMVSAVTRIIIGSSNGLVPVCHWAIFSYYFSLTFYSGLNNSTVLSWFYVIVIIIINWSIWTKTLHIYFKERILKKDNK